MEFNHLKRSLLGFATAFILSACSGATPTERLRPSVRPRPFARRAAAAAAGRETGKDARAFPAIVFSSVSNISVTG